MGGGPQRRRKTFATGRVCASPNCETIISKYNSAELCFRHAPATFRRLRGITDDTR